MWTEAARALPLRRRDQAPSDSRTSCQTLRRWEGLLPLWSAASGGMLGASRASYMEVTSVAFSPDGLFLVSSARRGGSL